MFIKTDVPFNSFSPPTSETNKMCKSVVECRLGPSNRGISPVSWMRLQTFQLTYNYVNEGHTNISILRKSNPRFVEQQRIVQSLRQLFYVFKMIKSTCELEISSVKHERRWKCFVSYDDDGRR